MPKPTLVEAGKVPSRPGTRSKSSAQKVVDTYVVESVPMLRDLPADGTAVLLHFTTEDDAGFAFTGATAAHLKDRCRRMVRSAMKEHLDKALDDQLDITYDIPITKHSDEALAVDGFRAFVMKKQR